MSSRNLLALSGTAIALLLAALMLSGQAAFAQKETVLYSGLDVPNGLLAFDSAGALYGTTQYGIFHGSVYRLSPPNAVGGAWTETDLYDFKGDDHGVVDGATPLGGVTIDPAGNLYGTTSQGGFGNRGAVFMLSPPASAGGAWTETILHFFGGSTNGEGPASSLLRVKSGVLYGTTQAGGAFGAGIVFRLWPPPTGQAACVENILYNFTGSSDGSTPRGGLVIDSSGNLYGQTSAGGSGFGTIYRLNHPSVPGTAWTETVLHTFSGQGDGGKPLGNLVFDSAGALYGTASNGATNNCGTVFQLVPPAAQGAPWTYSVLHAFSGVPDGCEPVVGVTLGLQPGVLYGATFMGGATHNGVGLGAIFRLTAPVKPGIPWTEVILHDFEENIDGAAPASPLLLRGGALYGTTQLGTVFKLIP